MTVRVGVVGAGSMGRNHVRVYSQLADAELVGVADADRDTAEAVAAAYATSVSDVTELCEEADAVSIAVPTAQHADVARRCITAGLAVLVEKPFVAEAASGEALIELATAHDCVLQVGHIERFNPAVEAAAAILADRQIRAVEARRLGPRPDRMGTDTVVADLMIHDVDVVRSLLGGPVDGVRAVGHADGDHATAVYAVGDTPVTLTASRLAQQKIRDLLIFTDGPQLHVDYLQQTVEIHRETTPGVRTGADAGIRYTQRRVSERPLIEQEEPLRRQLRSFLAAVEGEAEVVVSGADGLAALRTVDAIEQAVRAQMERSAG